MGRHGRGQTECGSDARADPAPARQRETPGQLHPALRQRDGRWPLSWSVSDHTRPVTRRGLRDRSLEGGLRCDEPQGPPAGCRERIHHGRSVGAYRHPDRTGAALRRDDRGRRRRARRGHTDAASELGPASRRGAQGWLRDLAADDHAAARLSPDGKRQPALARGDRAREDRGDGDHGIGHGDAARAARYLHDGVVARRSRPPCQRGDRTRHDHEARS